MYFYSPMDESLVHRNDKLVYHDQLISAKAKIGWPTPANSWNAFLHLGKKRYSVTERKLFCPNTWHNDHNQIWNPDCWIQSPAQWTLDLYTLSELYLVGKYNIIWQQKSHLSRDLKLNIRSILSLKKVWFTSVLSQKPRLLAFQFLRAQQDFR